MTKMGLVVVVVLAGCVDVVDEPSTPSNDESTIRTPTVQNGTIHSGLTPFAMDGFGIHEMTSDATHLYWIHNGEVGGVGCVKRMPLAGGPIETLTTVSSRVYSLSVSGGFVYFTGTHDGSGNYAGAIYKMPATGGTPIVLTTGFNPTSLSVDGEWVYYSEAVSPGGRILRVSTSGGHSQEVVCDVDNPWDLVAKDGVLFYSEMNRGRMMRVVPGHAPVVLAHEGWCSTGWMTVDDSFVYFVGTPSYTACAGIPNLYRVPRTGGASEILMAAPGSSGAGKLAIAGDHLLWSDVLSSADGSQPTILNTDPAVLFHAVEARSDAIFFADYYTGAMYRSPL